GPRDPGGHGPHRRSEPRAPRPRRPHDHPGAASAPGRHQGHGRGRHTARRRAHVRRPRGRRGGAPEGRGLARCGAPGRLAHRARGVTEVAEKIRRAPPLEGGARVLYTLPVMTPPPRSRNWFAPKNLDGFMHRSYLKAEGFSDAVFDGRPVVGICNSWSELNNCNAHLRQLAEAVKRWVWSAGGFPLEFPVISLGEILMKPTTMLFRNLMAMDVEECIRAYPLDSVVLLAGCDKTTPPRLMGAASADVPCCMVTGGPMLRGMWSGQAIGSGTDARKLWGQRRAGEITDETMGEGGACLSRSSGHCMVMGTASTMAAMAETLGLTLPGNAAIPAADSRRLVLAEESGRRAVEMALARGPRPSEIL